MQSPYVIPSMSDVAQSRGKNGFTMVSTFSGAGGSCLGFEMAGFEIVWASEFVEEARRTYEANHPGVTVDGRDIREVTAEEILAATGLQRGALHLFEGSPPCASFSTAGMQEKGWGKVKAYSDREQRSDDLFFEYARLLEGLQPQVFTAENVAGLVKGKAIGYFKEILAALRACGYAVDAKVVDASWLGVPQARQRLIFVGVRNDIANRYKIRPAHPKPRRPRYTIREVLKIDHVTKTTCEITHDPETGQDVRLDRYAIAAAWDKIRPGQSSERYFQLVRPALDEPVGTITATAGNIGAAGVTHPTQRRKFTLKELRVLSSFPEDFILTGTYAQRWERIGRSVPPIMARAIAETIRDEILKKMTAQKQR